LTEPASPELHTEKHPHVFRGIADACPECGAATLVRDPEAGEVVCPGCGLVVTTLIDAGPEWRVFTPRDVDRVRGGPATANPLNTTGTRITSPRRHHDGEAKAAALRLKAQQRQTRAGDNRSRNFYHAAKTLFSLGGQIHAPRSITDQAADIYRRAYSHNMVRGRSIHGIIAGCIYAAYRVQRVPRSFTRLAEAMQVNPRDLARTYRLLITELDLSTATPRAEDYMPRLQEALGLTAGETRAAIDLLREARHVKHTAGKNPRGLAAGAVYLATRDRSASEKITQAAIAEASGVTEVTIRNRYQALKKLAEAP
jgi:transcription initiation factor TFIIB